MRQTEDDILGGDELQPKLKRRRHVLRRVAAWTLGVVAGLVVLVVGGLALATWLMTPERLSSILDTEVSKRLKADLSTRAVRFTFWSTFPKLRVEIDTITLRSRTFDSLPMVARKRLPGDADSLVTLRRVAGALDVMDLTRGRVSLSDIEVDSLRVNLVQLDDSTDNFHIAKGAMKGKMPLITLDSVRITGPIEVGYRNLQLNAAARAALRDISLRLKEKNHYAVRLGADVSANRGSRRLLSDFPVNLDGDVMFDFDPLRVKVEDYKVTLGPLHGSVTMRAVLGDQPRIDRFQYSLQRFSLGEVMKLLPDGYNPMPAGLAAEAELEATARLTEPYLPADGEIPDAEVQINARDASVDYRAANGKRYAVRNADFTARMVVDGDRLSESYAEIPMLMAEGEGVRLAAKGSVRHLGGNPEVLAEVVCDGDIERLSELIPQLRDYGAEGHVNLAAEMSYQAGRPLGEALSGRNLAVTGRDVSMTLDQGGLRAEIEDIDFTATGGDDEYRTLEEILDTMPLTLTARAARVGVTDRQDTITASLGNVLVNVSAMLPDTMPSTLEQLMAMGRGSLSLTAERGRFDVNHYPEPMHLRDLDVAASFDSVALRNITFKTGSSGGSLSGSVGNLRQYVMSDGNAPLRLDFDADLDTIEINEITRTFTAGHPAYAAHVPEESLPSDTVTLLVPRNLEASLRWNARRSQYYNLKFHDLAGQLTTHEGNLKVSGVKIGTDFGDVGLSFTYDTRDLQSISTSSEMSITGLDLTDFFRNFHGLLEAAPELKNLDATFSARYRSRMLVFPSMYLNVPSAVADIRVNASDIDLHQNRFIRKITRMMLIHDSGDIHIPDMTIRARVRDNLVEVFPFDFRFNKYRLRLEGLNNFSGRLFYHIGVMDWPLRIPFGINIKGTYDHPKLRFGGAHWKAREGAEVTERIMGRERINMVAMIRKYLYKFVMKGAEYRPGDSF